MKVILIKEVDNLGGAYELVDVRPGYARNFLIPQKYAIEASASNLKQLNERQKVQKKKEEALLASISQLSAVLAEAPVKVSAKVGDNGKLYGSITTVQVARAIREQRNYEIDRRKINIIDEVKETGTFNAVVDFGAGKQVEFKIEVIAE